MAGLEMWLGSQERPDLVCSSSHGLQRTALLQRMLCLHGKQCLVSLGNGLKFIRDAMQQNIRSLRKSSRLSVALSLSSGSGVSARIRART